MKKLEELSEQELENLIEKKKEILKNITEERSPKSVWHHSNTLDLLEKELYKRK